MVGIVVLNGGAFFFREHFSTAKTAVRLLQADVGV